MSRTTFVIHQTTLLPLLISFSLHSIKSNIHSIWIEGGGKESPKTGMDEFMFCSLDLESKLKINREDKERGAKSEFESEDS